jgi:hypothetical protein
MFKLKSIILLVCICLSAKITNAQNEYIYLVKAYKTNASQDFRALTGFRVRGLKGIWTALHGVADCKIIKIRSNKEGELFTKPLDVVKVDIKRDLALLSSDEIDALPADGFELASNVQWDQVTRVTVTGHPYGIEDLTDEYRVRHPKPIRPLKDLLYGSDSLRVLKRRGSPNPDLKVVSIQGQIKPGQSGAPVLDESNRVIAVANGGFKELSDITWAIPLQKIEWENATANSKLQALAHINAEGLFSFENPDSAGVGTRPPSDQIRDMWLGVDIAVDISDKELSGYFNRLNQETLKLVEEYNVTQMKSGEPNAYAFNSNRSDGVSVNPLSDDGGYNITDKDGRYKVGSFDFTLASPYLPNRLTEELAFHLLNSIYIFDIKVYNPPISQEQYKSQTEPDLSLTSEVRILPEPSQDSDRSFMNYVPGQSFVVLESDSIKANPSLWNRGRKLYSTDALAGAKIFITLKPKEPVNNAEVAEFLSRVSNNIIIDRLNITVNDQIGVKWLPLGIPRKSLIQFKHQGAVVYEYSFPEEIYWWRPDN